MNTLNTEFKEASELYKKGKYKEAYEKYLTLASEGNSESQVFLGWMISNGIGVKKDINAGGGWFKRAALMGSSLGAFYYGLFLTINGEDKDAFSWYLKAAKRGDTPGIFRMGYSYIYGKGVPVDTNKGYKYLLSASAKGHLFARREIAVLDMKGNRGLIYRIKGLVQFVNTILLAFIIYHYDAHSDRLRC